ncbi:MAG: ABC transporter substrate-binding protein [Deltaproteobacteria bacterium]|nr:ABC transporter substrate-binding protein [Deltaproteobacteria bacterium]
MNRFWQLGRFAMSAIWLLVVAVWNLPQSSSAADKLRIGYGAPTATMAPLWIAQEGAIFARNGLDVEVLYLESALVQRALIAGEIQFGEMTGALLSPPRLQGADVVMVLGFVDRLLFRLVARSEIKTAADLKGKRIGTSRYGAAIDRAARLLLPRLGVNPDKDVIFIQIGSEATLLPALLGKVVDATLLQPPRYKKAVEAGMNVLANLEEMNIPFQHTGLVTTQRFVGKNPDIARRVVKSFVDGIHLMRTNSQVAKKAINRHMRLNNDHELEETYQLLKRVALSKPYPTIEGIKTILNDLSDQIPAAKTADPKEFVDTRFLEELDKSGYIDRLYR